MNMKLVASAARLISNAFRAADVNDLSTMHGTRARLEIEKSTSIHTGSLCFGPNSQAQTHSSGSRTRQLRDCQADAPVHVLMFISEKGVFLGGEGLQKPLELNAA